MDKEWENIYQVKWSTRAGKGDCSEESERLGTIQVTVAVAWLANGILNEDSEMFVWFIGIKKQDKELVPSLKCENRIIALYFELCPVLYDGKRTAVLYKHIVQSCDFHFLLLLI